MQLTDKKVSIDRAVPAIGLLIACIGATPVMAPRSTPRIDASTPSLPAAVEAVGPDDPFGPALRDDPGPAVQPAPAGITAAAMLADPFAGDPLGGEVVGEASLDLRFPLFKILKGAAFVDDVAIEPAPRPAQEKPAEDE